MAKITLEIENMHCGSCVRRVTQVLNAAPGTHADEVRIGQARVTAEEAGGAIQALGEAGFPARVAAGA